MNNIRPGILVEIVFGECVGPYDFLHGKKYVGHVGMVIGLCDDHPTWGKRWEIEGTNTSEVVFTADWLRPIDDGIVDDLIQVWQINSRQGVPA